MKTIIEMAREAGGLGFVHDAGDDPSKWQFTPEELVRFATLVLASADPQSSMAWQEGNEAGRLAEREACANLADEYIEGCEGTNFGVGKVIRARGQPPQEALYGMNQDDWKDVVAAISKVRDGRGIYLACRPADVFKDWFLALGTAKVKENT
jgi:hypothetical protein